MEIWRNIRFTIPKPSAPQLRKLITFEIAFLENNENTICCLVAFPNCCILWGLKLKYLEACREELLRPIEVKRNLSNPKDVLRGMVRGLFSKPRS